MKLLFLPVLLAAASASLLTSCDRSAPHVSIADENRAAAELRSVRRELEVVRKGVEAKNDELELAKSAVQSARQEVEAKEQQLSEEQAKIQAIQTELDEFKKQDFYVFAEIAAVRQQGLPATAITRYEQFVKAFPKSPLVTSSPSRKPTSP